MKNKKGFTLIEIAIVVAMSGFAMLLWMRFDNERTTKNKINEMYSTVNTVINNAIYNPIKGYVSDKGGDCSSNFDTKDITAARLQKCTSLYLEIESGTDDYDPEDSFFYFLNFLSELDFGCKVYFANQDTNALKVFLDCGNLKDNLPGKTEQGFSSYLKNENPVTIKHVYGEATDLNTTTGGDSSDGKVLVVLED